MKRKIKASTFVVCTSTPHYAEFLTTKVGWSRELATEVAETFVVNVLPDIVYQFWYEHPWVTKVAWESSNYQWTEGFCRKYARKLNFVAYGSSLLEDEAKVLDERIVATLQPLKRPADVAIKPTNDEVMRFIAASLRSCINPVTRHEIARLMTAAFGEPFHDQATRALRKLAKRKVIYIVPAGAPGRWQRGFVAVGSPTDTQLPAKTPRWPQWLSEIEFYWAAMRAGLIKPLAPTDFPQKQPRVYDYYAALDMGIF